MSVASTSPDPVVVECAALLAAAEARRQPIPPLTDKYPNLSLPDAYRIQQYNITRRTNNGERVIGHKIGLTAKVMQELFKVNEPDYGHLLDTMVHDASMPLDLSELIDPQIEIEPAFVLGKALKGPGVTIAQVLAATDYVCVSLEVIDSRIIDWRIKLQDTVADNGSSARVVVGKHRMKPEGLRLDDLETVLEVDAAQVERGSTKAILGHPAEGVAWLANSIGEYGASLAPGDLVLPGTCTRSYRLGGLKEVKGRIAQLGEVTLQLKNNPAIRKSK
jgi:2-keto-4-pentenoate hydratase